MYDSNLQKQQYTSHERRKKRQSQKPVRNFPIHARHLYTRGCITYAFHRDKKVLKKSFFMGKKCQITILLDN